MQAQSEFLNRLELPADLAQALADEFGTPLYVMSEAHIIARLRAYSEASRALWPRVAHSYATKANSAFAVLQIVAREGFHLDVASLGELEAARRAGIPASQCNAHGNNKSLEYLAACRERGVRGVVLDHAEEIEVAANLGPWNSQFLLRLNPAVDANTHVKISTAHHASKFGFLIADGSAERALVRALELGLPVVGVHAHVGSQLLDAQAQVDAGRLLAGFCAEMRARHGWEASVLNVGGGLGAHYVRDVKPASIADYEAALFSALRAAFSDWADGDLPAIEQEPGRSIVAESGVTLLRVGCRKDVGGRKIVVVDGGLSDNPRPVMYGAQYDVVAAGPAAEVEHVDIVGSHCESDDLFADVALPRNVKRGDVVQVLTTGAYNASMASNYNRFLRPAMVMIRPDGTPQLVQRRESLDDLFVREMSAKEGTC